MNDDFTGLNGFIWFVGVVEDRLDPHFIGRVRVRCFGHHTGDKENLPTKDLPWAQSMLPVTSAGISGVGQSPIGLVEGSHVFGFFRDGKNRQEPVIMGSLPAYPVSYGKPGKGFYSPIKATDDPYSPHKLEDSAFSEPEDERVRGELKDYSQRYLTKENSNYPRWRNSPDTNQMVHGLIVGDRSLSAGSICEVVEHPSRTLYKGLMETFGHGSTPGTDPFYLAEALVSEGGGGGIFGGALDVLGGLGGDIVGNVLGKVGLGGITKKITGMLDISDFTGELGEMLQEGVLGPIENLATGIVSYAEGIEGKLIESITTGASAIIGYVMPEGGLVHGMLDTVDEVTANLGGTAEYMTINKTAGNLLSPNQITKLHKDNPNTKLWGLGATRELANNYKEKVSVYQNKGYKYYSDAAGKLVDKQIVSAQAKVRDKIVAIRDEVSGSVIDYVADMTGAVNIAGRVLGTQPVSFAFPDIDDVVNTTYPYNHVYESESGHIMEYDDTPGATRLHQRHNSGTGYMITHDGSKTDVIVGNEFKVVTGDVYEMIRKNEDISAVTSENTGVATADKNLIIDGHYRIHVNASGTDHNHYEIVVGKGANVNIQVDKGDINLNAMDGRINLNSGEHLNINTGGDLYWKCDGKFIVNAADNMTLKGKNIYLN